MDLKEMREVDGGKRERKINERRGGEQEVNEGFSAEKEKEKEGRKGKVRRATFDDLEAIMDINDNIYEGFDYMPVMFYAFMHSKQHVIYVYEEDGKLISLANLRFYPECPDLMALMSGRVRRSHEGRGLGTSESSPLLANILKEHAKITRSVADTMYKPNIAAKIRQWKLLYHWNFLLYTVVDRLWLNRCTHIRQMALSPTRPVGLSYARATEWLERSDQLVRFVSKYAVDFFPVGHTWTPTPISRSGLRDAFSTNNVFVSCSPAVTSAIDKNCFFDPIPSTGNFRKQNSGCQRIEDRGQTDEIIGLSFSSGLPCKYGLVIDIHFFGDCENVFLSHVYSHLFHYVNMMSDDVVRLGIGLQFPLAISSKNVAEQLKEGMGESVRNNTFSVTQAVQYMRKFPEAKL